MKIAYLGNYRVPFTTESHVAASFEILGHKVVRLQEGDRPWDEIEQAALDADLFWWTRTWIIEPDRGFETLARLRTAGIPSVSHHLDLYVSLEREAQIPGDPFWHTDAVFTADGDHDEELAALGVRHHWLPPAVFGAECVPGRPQPRYAAPVVFVGSWKHYAHTEHPRAELVAFLQHRYGRRFAAWPRGRAVRGQGLNDLYASCKVVVGDSCFADRSRRYFSDRPFETVGRGGFIVMPWIEGLAELLVDGEHCRYFPPGDWDELARLVDHYCDPANEAERRRIGEAGQAHVREHHTYAHRLTTALGVLESEGLVERSDAA